ncbi:protein FAR1-RELATED SEQUENCE 5-like [Rosa rugosa]|uniref:protein FAR1-RELATED SEQUENCE 5-like n=1 Tax=Rosa rugosa TaxID=74645 RepID=UPI002B408190|nr:protein FAR1-RELATED SEQUENCE 5-like [Rosa rugosa]
MVLRNSISNTKRFFQKTLGNLKNLFSAGSYEKLPKSPAIYSTSMSTSTFARVHDMNIHNTSSYKDLDKLYNDFTDQWDSKRQSQEIIIDVESDDENNEGNKREDPSIVNRQGSFDEDDLSGKMVCCEVEAYEFYNSYAARIGFSVRKGKKRRDADRLVIRTGCKAMIRFTLAEDMWRVSHFHAEHNHELVKPEERPFLRSNRKMSEAHKGVIKSMRDARIGIIKTYSYLAEEVGGSQNVRFTKRDCYNYVNNDKMAMFETRDVM